MIDRQAKWQRRLNELNPKPVESLILDEVMMRMSKKNRPWYILTGVDHETKVPITRSDLL